MALRSAKLIVLCKVIICKIVVSENATVVAT